jgi:LPS export ABC transporter protein LptC
MLTWNKIFKITIAILVVVILVIHSSCTKKNKVENIDAIKDRSLMPSLNATDITTVISDSGITRYRISAPKWEIYDKVANPYWEFSKGIHFEKFDENLVVDANIHSNYARYNQYQKIWELKGNVRMTNLKGELFETEHLFWDENGDRIYSDTIVKITQTTSIIHAVGFESNQKLTKYVFKSTRGIFPVEN